MSEPSLQESLQQFAAAWSNFVEALVRELEPVVERFMKIMSTQVWAVPRAGKPPLYHLIRSDFRTTYCGRFLTSLPRGSQQGMEEDYLKTEPKAQLCGNCRASAVRSKLWRSNR